MKVKIGEERLVCQGPAYEDTIWGVMQFPTVYKLDNGNLVVRTHVGDDSWTEIGRADKEWWHLSEDLGKTWKKVGTQQTGVGLTLSNGERIYFPPQQAVILPPDAVKARRGFTEPLPSDKIVKEPDGSMPYPSFRYLDIAGQENLIYDFDYLPDEYNKKEWHMLRTGIDGVTREEIVPLDIPTMSTHGVMRRYLDNTLIFMRPYPIGHVKQAPDGSIWAITYLGAHLNPYNKAPSPKSAVAIFRSTDNAKSFKLHSYIPEIIDTFKHPNAWLGSGYNEADFEFMDDGSVIIFMRTVDVFSGGPEWNDMYFARSTDNGLTWSEPTSFGCGVLPSLVKLKCGATLAAYGRPGIFVRACFDKSGQKWEDPIEIMTPNDRSRLMNNPPERPNFHQWAGSCCNVELKPFDDNTAMLVYSDFYVPDASGKTNKKLKSIMFRMITVEND